MTAELKRGRRHQNKSWDLLLRHTFRSNYLEDTDLHALMFVCGDHFTAIMQRALREFASNHGLPTNDNDFQSKLYFAASKLISENRQKPDQIDVLESMGEASLLEKVAALSGAKFPPMARPAVQSPPSIVVAKVEKTTQPKPAPIAAPDPAPNQPPVSTADPKPRLPLPEMDFGPEIDENELATGTDTEVKKPPLKDRWLSRHKD